MEWLQKSNNKKNIPDESVQLLQCDIASALDWFLWTVFWSWFSGLTFSFKSDGGAAADSDVFAPLEFINYNFSLSERNKSLMQNFKNFGNFEKRTIFSSLRLLLAVLFESSALKA